MSAKCLATRSNPVCSLCEENFYLNARGDCIQCTSKGGSIASFVLMALVVIFVLCLQVGLACACVCARVRVCACARDGRVCVCVCVCVF